MIKLASIIAEELEAPALISGESVGQVASQTLSNIRATADTADRPILRPLAGMNKEDIISRAGQIGTYEISIEPYEDCCSFFVPVHPATRARLRDIHRLESRLNLEPLIVKAMDNAEFETITPQYLEKVEA